MPTSEIRLVPENRHSHFYFAARYPTIETAVVYSLEWLLLIRCYYLMYDCGHLCRRDDKTYLLGHR